VKLLITTRADAVCLDWVELTHPIIRRYADRVNADFIVLDEAVDRHEATGGIGNGVYQYRIMEHYNLHEEYDRILHLDTDMLIAPDCPNLFEEVPEDHIGSIYEDLGSRKGQRIQCMLNAQAQYGDIGWRERYINTGVFVTSKMHRDIYQKIDGKYFVDWGTDDIHIGYLINKYGYKVKELGYRYNHMTMFSEEWNGSPSRFDSHIIHYAGQGIFEQSAENKLHQAKLDYERLYK
jgi:lipopolysaccharide biosynthesis glycosyltransferase